MMPVITVEGMSKTFTLHNQGSMVLPVLRNVSMQLRAGEALVLTGASGAGKSTLLRTLYGNYKPTAGKLIVRHKGRLIDLVTASPRVIVEIRRHTLGWVSQFLRVIPRVTTIDIVRDPLLQRGVDRQSATYRAEAMLQRVNLPKPLWSLPPQTFSGGEQQRVNIARSFVDPAPILLLDEPTASLDASNRDTVVELINGARAQGSAVVGIFHDENVRDRIATRLLDISQFKP